MTEGAGAGLPLPRGATGFLRPGDAPLPHTSLRAFRAAVYTAARLAGGRVGEVREQVYPSTFHTASVLDGTGETVVAPAYEVLKRRGYGGWVSLEAFDFSFPPEQIVSESIDHLKSEIARMA